MYGLMVACRANHRRLLVALCYASILKPRLLRVSPAGRPGGDWGSGEKSRYVSMFVPAVSCNVLTRGLAGFWRSFLRW
jgi:hypothetical protein